MLRRPLLCVIALVVAPSVSACKRSTSDAAGADDDHGARRTRTSAAAIPRVVLIRTVDKQQKIFVASASGNAEPTVAFEGLALPPRSARAIDGGRALLVHGKADAATAGDIYRIDVGAIAPSTVRVAEGARGVMLQASADGSAVLLSDNDATTKTETLSLMRTNGASKAIELMKFRYYAGGELSSDGRVALLSGTPVSCATPPLASCPMELWRATIDGESAKLEPISIGGSSARYQPRFYRDGGLLGGSTGVVFQTTENDGSPECAKDLNACRHDIVLLSDRDLAATPQLLRKGGFGPSLSPRGDRLAFLSIDDPDTKCTKLPCLTTSLYVGDVEGGAFQRIVAAGVSMLSNHAWSPDGAWLAFRGPPEPKESYAKVCRADGTQCRTLGEGYPQGWIW